jgi:hypothetical protein
MTPVPDVPKAPHIRQEILMGDADGSPLRLRSSTFGTGWPAVTESVGNRG